MMHSVFRQLSFAGIHTHTRARTHTHTHTHTQRYNSWSCTRLMRYRSFNYHYILRFYTTRIIRAICWINYLLLATKSELVIVCWLFLQPVRSIFALSRSFDRLARCSRRVLDKSAARVHLASYISSRKEAPIRQADILADVLASIP